MNKKSKTFNMTLCAMFTALIAIGAFIRIPVPYIPFTLQLFFVTLSGLISGSKWGALSALLYMLIGLFGAPVFTEGGGFGYILKPSFGYILAFPLGAFITGKLSETFRSPTLSKQILSAFSGLAIVYSIGMCYAFLISNYYLDITLNIKSLFIFYFLTLIPGDAVLSIMAAWLSLKLKRHYKIIA